MKLWHACLALVAIFVAGCGSAKSVVGTWTLYIPADAKAQAEQKHEPVPAGSAEFKSDGTCRLAVEAGEYRYSFEGTYSVEGTTLKVDGTEKASGGVKTTRKRTMSGVLSEDFKTFRIDGKDFQR